MIKKLILASVLLFLIFPIKSFASVEYITINVTGFGKDQSSATSDALAEALAQISGVIMSSESKRKTVESFLSDGKDQNYFNSDDFQQQVNQKTKGVIKNYKIIKSVPSASLKNTWEVVARVTIIKNKLSKQANRKRIAVLPFRVSNKQFIINKIPADKDRIIRILSQELTSYLTQTRKFFVADREFISEILSERAVAKNSSASIEEMVKIGNDLAVDLLVVGVIEDISNEAVTKKFKTLNKTFTSNKGVIEISYRIIDVSTRQVKLADLYVSDNGSETTNPDTGMIQSASLSIGNYILSAIYPLRVEAIEDETLFIGQGGKQINVGETYELYHLGKELKDSYTGESLGRIESKIGRVEIVQVTSKFSSAILLDVHPDDLLGMIISDLILRPLSVDSNESELVSHDKVTEEIELNKKEREEKDDDNW